MKVVIINDCDLSLDFFPHRKEGEDPVRSPGCHLTDVIKSVMEESGISRTVSGAGWAPTQLNLAAEVGFMWEEILSRAMKERLPVRLDEVMVDGIAMSPDGVEWDEESGSMVLSEYKAVWHSVRRSPADNFKWMSQIMGYCLGVGTRIVKMYILYLNGDWKGSGPIYKGFRIEFSEMEIRENWMMLTNHARNKGWIK